MKLKQSIKGRKILRATLNPVKSWNLDWTEKEVVTSYFMAEEYAEVLQAKVGKQETTCWGTNETVGSSLWMGGDILAVELAEKLKEIPGGYQEWSHWRDVEISEKLLGYLWNSPGTCLWVCYWNSLGACSTECPIYQPSIPEISRKDNTVATCREPPSCSVPPVPSTHKA